MLLKDRRKVDVIRYRVAIGRPKTDSRKAPERLDHFEVTETSVDASGDFVLARPIMDELGKAPREVPILVDSDNIEDFVSQAYECREKIGNRVGMYCRGDGVKAKRKSARGLVVIDCKAAPQRDDGTGYPSRSPLELAAALKKWGSWQEPYRCAMAQNHNPKDGLRCSPTTEMVFRLAHAAGGGFARYRSHGHATADRIVQSLRDIQQITAGQLRGVPLKLVATRKRMTDPTGRPVTQTVVHVELAMSPQDALRVALEGMQSRAQLEDGLRTVRAYLAAPRSPEELASIDAEFPTEVEASVAVPYEDQANDERPSGAPSLPVVGDDGHAMDDALFSEGDDDVSDL